MSTCSVSYSTYLRLASARGGGFYTIVNNAVSETEYNMVVFDNRGNNIIIATC